MKSLNSIITCFFLTLLLTNSVFSAENIHVQNAWIREAPPTIKVMAGYLEIKNSSDKALTLVSAESTEFERIEFHLSQTEDDVARMKQQNEIIIAPGSTLSFEPGSYHLMLFNNTVPMREGKLASIKLIFTDHETVTFDAMVKRSGPNEHHRNHEHRH